ncbi:AraC family transcriptional regulator [Streptomyces hilarionis]|uniref:AraC family transcriptional regulator n=1 Tax=Streptomyces hilarionis TaxID=2839954 RepID=UPI00211A1C66|nr:AraC family transcriptional regulator [Streptomyces hilarionis]MCQ9136167.1 AraC family transcriptional regulator [Streptomyces hilarionis]
MADSGERARHWRYAELPDVDLLRARYVRKTFVRHTHEHFVIAAIAEGVEVFAHRGADQYAGPGALALVNPDTPHTGRAGVPEGWRYGAVYPSPDVVAEIAAETTTLRGAPGFVRPVLDDPCAAALVHQVLRAAEEGNALAADTLLRVAVTRLLRLNGGPLPQREIRSAGARIAARARAALEDRLVDPPTLEQLAEDLGTGSFALLRAFRDAYGLPPHAWLTDARVRRARRLLDAGTAPAEAAVAVGFTDQPHLNRHFARIVGVPPGAYQRERKNVQDPVGSTPLPSEPWQNRQLTPTQPTPKRLTRTRRPWTSEQTRREDRTAPSYGTPSPSASPSDSPGSPSG